MSDTITLRKKLAWIAVLYFAEGLPLGLVYDVLPVYFRQNGVSLKEIGFMFFLTLPWAVKVFWSPLVDRFGERRTWVTLCCAVMAALMLVVPLFDPKDPTFLLYAALLAFTLASATQDIAIDAYAIGILAKGEEGVANGFRVAFYRVALLLGGGGTMWLVKPLGWTFIFLLLAGVFVVLAIAAWATPPVKVAHRPSREMARSFWRFVSRPGSLAIFAFILTFRLDILFIGPMIKPFWVDRGMSPEEIGTISTVAGAALSIAGAMIGGYITSKIGLFHALWGLGLAQALPSLAYAAVAQWDLGRPWLYGASMAESFGAGLGTASFFSFLMRICDKDQAATQYALLSALFGTTRFLGGWSGTVAEQIGYAPFFALTFLMGAPAYLFLPWVRRWIGNGNGQETGAAERASDPATSGADAPAGTAGRPASAAAH